MLQLSEAYSMLKYVHILIELLLLEYTLTELLLLG
jgi:hypothetical protein